MLIQDPNICPCLFLIPNFNPGNLVTYVTCSHLLERGGEEGGEGGGEEGREGQQAQNRVNCAKSMSPN